MADNATEAAARSPHGWLRGRPEGQHAAASHLRPHSGGAAPRTHTETMSITFDTDPRHIMERVAGKGSHVPLVVWLPRERLPEQFQ